MSAASARAAASFVMSFALRFRSFRGPRCTGALIEEPGSHMTCMGLSPVKGLFALAVQLICDCCLGFADGSLFGAEKAVLRPVACDQVPGARGRGQGTETLA